MDEEFKKWQDGSKDQKESLQLWKESISQLRHLEADVWNGITFYWAINALVFGGIFLVATGSWNVWNEIKILTLSCLGAFIAYQGRQVFKQHRTYYWEMLITKTLLEQELGFYQEQFKGRGLIFPWLADKKTRMQLFCGEVMSDRDELVKTKITKTPVSRRTNLIYIIQLIVYLLMAVICVLLLYQRFLGVPINSYFFSKSQIS